MGTEDLNLHLEREELEKLSLKVGRFGLGLSLK